MGRIEQGFEDPRQKDRHWLKDPTKVTTPDDPRETRASDTPQLLYAIKDFAMTTNYRGWAAAVAVVVDFQHKDAAAKPVQIEVAATPPMARPIAASTALCSDLSNEFA